MKICRLCGTPNAIHLYPDVRCADNSKPYCYPKPGMKHVTGYRPGDDTWDMHVLDPEIDGKRHPSWLCGVCLGNLSYKRNN